MLRGFVTFIVGIAFLVWESALAEEGPMVQVEQGVIQGKEVTSVLGKTFYSFQGVPYAQPPVGELRFKDARTPDRWNGTRDATQLGSKCAQYDNNISEYVGSEDCLFLNVYTPQLPKRGSKPLPVMFWIHGGTYVTGSGDDDIYGADYIVNESVILVTINYRLNCFGFLFLKKAAPGNVGLKDQVAAMRWVKQNIANFNGDPEKITIFGQSAGGSSVASHMLSPMTKGLFSGAIAQSGSPMNQWAIQYEPYEISLRLARAVNCPDQNDDETIECLRGVDYMDLFKTANTKTLAQRDIPRLDREAFVPTFDEEDVWGVERYFIGAPEQLLKHGCQHDVPFMTGLVDEEWMYNLAANNSKEPGLLQSQRSLTRLDSNWEGIIIPETRLPEDLDDSDVSQAIQEMRDFYLDGERLTTENVQGYRNMLSDLQFVEGTLYDLKYISKSNKSPTYLYFFTVDQKLNYMKKEFDLTLSGASHGDDRGYLFYVKSLPEVDSNDPSAVSRRREITLWTNFAKKWNPTPNDDPLIGLKWKPYTPHERNYFGIGNNLSTGTDLYAARFKFWEDLYDKYGAQPESGEQWTTCSS